MPPNEIRISRDRKQLVIEWADGTCSRLDAGHLRANCRSSQAMRSALDGGAAPPPEDLHIADLRLVGLYAINLVFSDGDDRGIYPWRYLRRLGGEGTDDR